MLVWLAEHLVKYYSGFNVFSYLTFRAIVSLLTALFISLWMGPRMIAHLQKLSFGQVVRNDGPESHFSKRFQFLFITDCMRHGNTWLTRI